jgi:class 3 adenylate cyclase
VPEARHDIAPRPLPPALGGGRYRPSRFLGEGGRKRVYLARDEKLARDVALAVIKIDGLDETGLARVRREAQAMARLGDHPNIVTVHDFGEEDTEAGRQPFIVSQYMGGGDLEARLAAAPDGRFDIPQAVRIAADVCRALEYAHSNGLMHRDIKPGNVWFTPDGAVKLGDFGLAVALEGPRVTVEGMMVGTVAYMAPEQALGGPPDARSDIYSLGCVLYEMLTGRPPFPGDDALGVISQHMNTPAVALSWHNPQVPSALEALVMSMLEKDPQRRPSGAAEVTSALAGIELGPQVAAAGAESRTPGGQTAPIYRRTFIGREAELERLRAAFDLVVGGAGDLIMVVGEPGIGKTSICEQLSTYVVLKGGRTLVGHCYEEGSLSLPYLPFVEALRSYVLDREPEALSRELGQSAPEVARIVSEIRDRIDVETLPLLDPAEERYRLLQAVSSFLRNASRAQPLMVVLEDLHDADRGTLDMLTYLARNLGGTRVLILGTYRDVEVDRMHPLSGALSELRRGGQFERILLRGLTTGEVQRMLAAIAGHEVQWGLAEAVHRQTEGNPLFVQEVTRYLAEEGLVRRQGTRWQSTTENLALSIPEGLRDVIGKRLSRLSADCNRLLQIASVSGREFALETLRTVASVAEDELLEGLEEAVRIGVLEERTRGSEVRYRFAHAFFRQSLYEELIAPRRIRMHQQVAQALEKHYQRRLDEHAAELAEHFSYSSDAADLAKAVRYSEMAAARASEVYAHSEAAAHLQKAIDIQEVLDPTDTARRCDLLLDKAEPQRLGGDIDGARSAVLEAAHIARSGDDRARLVAAAAVATRQMGIIGLPDPEMEEFFKEALPYADIENDPLGVRILARVAFMQANQAQLESAVELADRAWTAANRLGDPTALGFAALARLTTAVQPWQIQDRRALADTFEAAATADGDPELRAVACAVQLGLALFTGDITEAERQRVHMAEMVERYKLTLDRRTILAIQSELARIAGDMEEAEQQSREATEAQSEINWSILTGPNALSLGPQMALFAERGILEEIAEGERAFLETMVDWRYAPARAVRFYVLAGDKEKCREAYDRLLEGGGQGLSNDNQPGFLVACAAEGCVFLEDTQTAPVIYEILLPYSGYNLTLRARTPGFFGPADRYLGMLASLIGRWEDAESHFIDATAFCERMPSPSYLAQTRYDYAQMFLRRAAEGDRHRALDLLSTAGEAAQRMGMVRLAGLALEAKALAQGISRGDVFTSIDAVLESVEEERPELGIESGGSITVMFTDIESSTQINHRLGDLDWMKVLRTHNRIVRDQANQNGGHEVKGSGDGFMIVFADTIGALKAAIGIQQAIASHDWSGATGETIRVRIGLHTGDAVREGGDFFGRDVNMAARIAGQAQGGETVISAAVKALADRNGGFSFGEPRRAALKGLPGEHDIWPLNSGPS